MQIQRNQVVSDRYRVVEEIGRGSTSRVYKVQHILLGSVWAMKVLLLSSTDYSNAFNEAVLLRDLDHRCLPKVIDIFKDDTYAYIVRDYIDGETLDMKVEKTGPLDEVEMCSIIEQIQSVLKLLHSRDKPLIYRDLKPNNIIIKNSGDVVLVDFGIAREYCDSHDQDTVFLGTQGYAAPEQYGGTQSDARTDIFAFGALIYFMYTSDHAHTVPEGTRWSKFSGEKGDSLRKIIQKSMSYLQTDRHTSVEVLYLEVQELFETKDVIVYSQNCLGLTQTIGILGAVKGVGTSSIAFAIATALKQKGYRVCYVNVYGGRELSFLENAINEESFRGTKEEFKSRYRGMDLIRLKSHKEYNEILSFGYDYIVGDFGAQMCQMSSFLRCSLKYVVLPAKPWAYQGVALEVIEIDKYRDVNFLVSLSTKLQITELARWLSISKLRLKPVPYIQNPFDANEAFSVIEEILPKFIFEPLKVKEKKRWWYAKKY